MKVTVKNMSDYTKPNEELSEGENPKKKQIGFWCEIDDTDGTTNNKLVNKNHDMKDYFIRTS